MLFFIISSICFLTTNLSLSGVRLIGITFGKFVVRMECLIDFAFPSSLIFSVKREKYVSKRFFRLSFYTSGTPNKLNCGVVATLMEYIGNGGMINVLVSALWE